MNEVGERYGIFGKFLWGAVPNAQQIKGAYNEDGKGMGIWDTLTRKPGHIAHGENGGVARGHYHHYKENVALMKKMGGKIRKPYLGSIVTLRHSLSFAVRRITCPEMEQD